ncbi:MAG: FIST signal transduction protein [Cognaticolwellia sp.]
MLVPDTKSLLILANDADQWQPEQLDPILMRQTVPVFGGIFPELIYAGQQLKQGTLVVGLNVIPDLVVIENLSQGRESITAQLEQQSSVIKKEKSLITIVDGLAENIERFIEGLYGITGQNSTTLGCGAGSLDFVQKPCLFSNKGMICDAALVAGIPTPFKLGLSHGWQVLEGPYLVTNSNGNILETLNYSPAFDVYREHIEKNAGVNFDEHDFFDIAKTYPLGVENLAGEILVRDPIVLENKSLVCVGEVPENSVVYLLKGTPESLISAAGGAAKLAYETHGLVDNEDSSVLLFDCISRALFLDDTFDRELKSIEKSLNGYGEVFGALTLGEIGNSINGPIEWLNKSTAIAVF